MLDRLRGEADPVTLLATVPASETCSRIGSTRSSVSKRSPTWKPRRTTAGSKRLPDSAPNACRHPGLPRTPARARAAAGRRPRHASVSSFSTSIASTARRSPPVNFRNCAAAIQPVGRGVLPSCTRVADPGATRRSFPIRRGRTAPEGPVTGSCSTGRWGRRTPGHRNHRQLRSDERAPRRSRRESECEARTSIAGAWPLHDVEENTMRE